MKSKLYNNLLLLGLTSILVFSPIAKGAVPKRLWAITPILLIVTLMVFMWLWRVNNRRESIARTVLDKPLFIFSALAVISFVFSIYKHDSFYALLRLFSYIGLYYLMINNYSLENRRYLVGLVIFAGSTLSIFGLVQYFDILSSDWWIPRDFLAATYVNHNHFAGYLELVIPVTIGVLVHYKALKNSLRLLLIEALMVMLVAFVFTQSRGGWISLFIALAIMSGMLLNQKKIRVKTMLIFIVLILISMSFIYMKSDFVSSRIETFAEIPKGEASLETRVMIWQGTLHMIRNNFLTGTGIGTFVWGFPNYKPAGLNMRIYYAHNDYLHIAAEMGVFALITMVWLLTVVIRKGLRRGNTHPVVLGCAVGLLSLSLHGLIDFNFHIPANMILFTMYTSIVIRESREGVA